MKFWSALLVGMVTAATFGVPANYASADSPSAEQRFKALYTRERDWRRNEYPYVDDSSTKPVVDHLPKVDETSQQARLGYWSDVMKALDTIPRAELSPPAQLDYDVYRPQIQVLINGQRLRDYEMPANSDSSFWGDFNDTVDKPFRTLADYRNFLLQMRDIPRYFAEEIVDMRAGLKRGFTPPAVTMQGRDASITAVSEARPDATLFYRPFQEMPGNIPPDEQAKLRDEAVQTIETIVKPAYAGLLKFMREEYLPGLRKTIAAADLPGGADYYRAKIKEFTTLDMDADAIHQF